MRSLLNLCADYFQEKGGIELEAKHVTDVYAVLQPAFDRTALGAELSGYFAAKETSEVARIHAMLAFFASEQCLSQRLAAYFGDDQAPLHCGHCSVCLGQVAHLPALAPLPALDAHNFAALCDGLMERHRLHHSEPLSAETLTRFLCGITAPLLTRLKARSQSGFAALAHYPYAEVRRWVQDQIADQPP